MQFCASLGIESGIESHPSVIRTYSLNRFKGAQKVLLSSLPSPSTIHCINCNSPSGNSFKCQPPVHPYDVNMIYLCENSRQLEASLRFIFEYSRNTWEASPTSRLLLSDRLMHTSGCLEKVIQSSHTFSPRLSCVGHTIATCVIVEVDNLCTMQKYACRKKSLILPSHMPLSS